MYKNHFRSSANNANACQYILLIFQHRSHAGIQRTKRATGGKVVLTVADHEVRVTLNLGALVTMLHGTLEELSSLLRGGSGVEAELGDPDWLAVQSVGIVNLLDEAVEGLVISLSVEMNVDGIHDSVRAHLLEALEPVETHGGTAVGDGRTNDSNIRVCGGDGVHVL
jgi:hypothetical protein